MAGRSGLPLFSSAHRVAQVADVHPQPVLAACQLVAAAGKGYWTAPSARHAQLRRLAAHTLDCAGLQRYMCPAAAHSHSRIGEGAALGVNLRS